MPIKIRINKDLIIEGGGGRNLHTCLNLTHVCPAEITFIAGVSSEYQYFQNVMQGLEHSVSKSLAMLKIGSGPTMYFEDSSFDK